MNKEVTAKVNIKDDLNTIAKLNMYGNSLQDGTPSPTSPIEIESLGDETKNLFNVEKFVELLKTYDSTATEVTVDGRRCIQFTNSNLYHKDFYGVVNFEADKQYTWTMDIKHVEGLEGDNYEDGFYLGYVYEGKIIAR